MATKDHRRTTNAPQRGQAPRTQDVGEPKRRRGVRLDLPADELLARYAAGGRVPTLALRYDCSEPTVRARLRRLGALEPAAPRHTVAISRAALEQLCVQREWPIIRIAAHFGVCPATVDARRRALGIPARLTRGQADVRRKT